MGDQWKSARLMSRIKSSITQWLLRQVLPKALGERRIVATWKDATEKRLYARDRSGLQLWLSPTREENSITTPQHVLSIAGILTYFSYICILGADIKRKSCMEMPPAFFLLSRRKSHESLLFVTKSRAWPRRLNLASVGVCNELIYEHAHCIGYIGYKCISNGQRLLRQIEVACNRLPRNTLTQASRSTTLKWPAMSPAWSQF